MNVYARTIFPRLLDWGLSGQATAQYRQQVLAPVAGEVLEVGSGTGLNLPYYPSAVRRLRAVDPNPGMHRLAAQRCDRATFAIERHTARAEALPFADASFDGAVSTWTLCSIPALARALAEIRRTLKPSGCFAFLEHGLSPEPGVQRCQHGLTPLQKRIADGCHLNRDLGQAIAAAGFAIAEMNHAYLPQTPKPLGYLYYGTATKGD